MASTSELGKSVMWTIFFVGTSFFGIFVGEPILIWVVSAVFGVLSLAALTAKARFAVLRSLPLFIVFLLWLAYGFYERSLLVPYFNGEKYVPQPTYDIRVDLLLISPVLFFTTAIAIALSAWSFIGAFKSNREQSS
jgi:hypothetical protein